MPDDHLNVNPKANNLYRNSFFNNFIFLITIFLTIYAFYAPLSSLSCTFLQNGRLCPKRRLLVAQASSLRSSRLEACAA
jgi:hypothetical protein